MEDEKDKCCWCWWSRLNADNKLICTNVTSRNYQQEVPEDYSCYLIVNIDSV